MNLNVVIGFRTSEIKSWADKHQETGSLVYSDDLACFSAVLDRGCHNFNIVTGCGPSRVKLEAFAWVNTMIGNVKRSINGSYHTISPKQVPRYLAEFCYLFNRRFVLKTIMPRFLTAATNTPLMPGRVY